MPPPPRKRKAAGDGGDVAACPAPKKPKKEGQVEAPAWELVRDGRQAVRPRSPPASAARPSQKASASDAAGFTLALGGATAVDVATRPLRTAPVKYAAVLSGEEGRGAAARAKTPAESGDGPLLRELREQKGPWAASADGSEDEDIADGDSVAAARERQTDAGAHVPTMDPPNVEVDKRRAVLPSRESPPRRTGDSDANQVGHADQRQQPKGGESPSNGREQTIEREGGNDAEVCYICWEIGTADAPLVRDCDCRGSAGRAHLACLIDAARSKAKQGTTIATPNVFDPLLRTWARCPQCRQDFRDPTKTALRNAIVNPSAQWGRLLALAAAVGGRIAACSLYFLLLSCIEWSLLRLTLKCAQYTEQAWTATGDVGRTMLALAALGGLAHLPRDHWVLVWRRFRALVTSVATALSALFLLAGLRQAASCDHRQHGHCFRELEPAGWAALSASLGILVFQAYGHRRVMRDKILQMRREGWLAAVLGVATTVLLVVLRGGIDYLVYNNARERGWFGGEPRGEWQTLLGIDVQRHV